MSKLKDWIKDWLDITELETRVHLLEPQYPVIKSDSSETITSEPEIKKGYETTLR